MDQDDPPVLRPVDRPLDLVPVGLKEAALDSPTFRAAAQHFAEQLDHVEKWLDSYVKAAIKLAQDILQLESSINSWLQHTCPPANISEAVLDHDYTVLAAKRYADAARDFWHSTLKSAKKGERNIIDPIKVFMNNDLRMFKEARRHLDGAQKNFDSVLSRYAGQPKTKEASSLREDAFQVHEARKAYLKASLDFCVQGPIVRSSLDKLIVRIFSEQWREWKTSREQNGPDFVKGANEMERIRGWGREMENSERAFKRELLMARKQIEDSAELAVRPSRELDDYAEKTAPFLGSAKSSLQRPEKQGWLYVKSVTGKPARTYWTRRWYYVKNGIFGWLMQGMRSGGVEESERIGLLLCSIRPAATEERRFCFELKTKDTGLILQAESQNELNSWIDAFDQAKRKALEQPASTEPSASSTDAAFAISQPIAPEFIAKTDAHLPHPENDTSLSPETNVIQTRASFDVTAQRKVTGIDRDLDRELTSRSKHDGHRKATPGGPAGGIASLISSSHSVLPLGPPAPPAMAATIRQPMFIAQSSLAPSTLANPPAATNLSKVAIVVTGERGIRFGQADGTGMPGGLMANLWGSEKWGSVNRLERDGVRPQKPRSGTNGTDTSRKPVAAMDDLGIMDGTGDAPKEFGHSLDSPPSAPSKSVHRATLSASSDIASPTPWDGGFPTNYPLALRAQDAQFRTLFPDVPSADKVVLVFRATWNPNEQQEFPGRVFLTPREIYFYSHHLGFVLISGVSMETITEVTAAPGRDSDFLYIHMKDQSRPDDLRRITIKTFLEPLKTLERRVNYLVQNANSHSPAGLEQIIRTLLKMEASEQPAPAPDESGDEGAYSGGEDDRRQLRLPKPREHDIKPSLRIDGHLYGESIARTGRDITRFKLPSQPVRYVPPGIGEAALTKDINASAKAVFHVMFGDKSAVYQQLYRNRGASEITQSPWHHSDTSHSKRTLACRFDFGILTDTQTIDIANDHLCYVVTSIKVPINFPMSDRFFLMVKFVITHSAKSQCRLAVYQKLVWEHHTPMKRSRALIERIVHNNMDYEAQELVSLAMEQVTKLGANSSTNKAIHIFGHIGTATQPIHISGEILPAYPSAAPTRRIRKYTLVSIYRHEILRHVYRALSVVYDVIDALLKSGMSVVSAHTFLVLLLSTSALYNSWHAYRDGWAWYRDRQAASFLAKMGVGKDHAVSRQVYVRDYEDWLVPDVVNVTEGAGRTKCRAAFEETLAERMPDLAAGRAEGRLHRTRERLAGYRHDLLVALRVVNTVEREVVVAGWEEWLREEEGRCKVMGEILSGEQVGDLDEYCGGCRQEREALKKR